ncbi:MAG: CBS domain-containing protein [Actinomycetes bacterium]
MRVAEIMTEASITETPSETLAAAAERMWTQQTGSLLVMEGERLVGIVTERDILKAAGQASDLSVATVGETMTREVITTSADTPVRDAARLMAQHWIRHLPVVEDQRVVGVVSQRDIVGIFAALWREPEFPEIPTDELVRSRRLIRIEQGDLD